VIKLDLSSFLAEIWYIDWSHPVITQKAQQLFYKIYNPVEKAKIAFEYVRDKIKHSFDTNHITIEHIPLSASEVYKYGYGICHTKANLLAALLRSQKIPAGFCYQHVTLNDNDDSNGYILHCFNAVYLENQWIKLDARGNKPGINAQFSLNEPHLAFQNRKEYDEYFFNGIYSKPDKATMDLLRASKTLKEFIFNKPPEKPFGLPDIDEN